MLNVLIFMGGQARLLALYYYNYFHAFVVDYACFSVTHFCCFVLNFNIIITVRI